MHSKYLVPIWVVLALTMTGFGSDKKSAKALDRKILGAELQFGRDAAKFGLWNEAIFRWEKVVKDEPNNAQAVNNLAIAYEHVGDFEKARILYLAAMELDESSRDIKRNYKRFLSFYKRHQRQLEREKKIRESKQQRTNQQEKSDNKNAPHTQDEDGP